MPNAGNTRHDPWGGDMIASTTSALEALLAESPSAAASRRREAFDRIAGSEDAPIVIYGAGGLGRITLEGLRRIGRPPVAFADRKANASSPAIDGVPLLSPLEAVVRYGPTAVFVVAIWNAQTNHRFPETREALHRVGAVHVAPAIALFWKYPEPFLPYYCLDVPERVLASRDDILRLHEELGDDSSRDVLLRQMRWRMQMDFAALPLPVPGMAYFQDDLLPPRYDELFIDCGAYDGDTLHTFVPRMQGNRARTIAIEPDPSSHERLVAQVAALPADIRTRIRPLKVAVGRSRGKMRFTASGLASARSSETGSVEVDVFPLDEILDGEAPTLIKMDLEGAEVDALAGGASVIQRNAPSMAVCVYHCPDHLWAIPLQLRSMLPHHRLYLRPHGHEGWDLVCYAVAPERT